MLEVNEQLLINVQTKPLRGQAAQILLTGIDIPQLYLWFKEDSLR